jgi:hypothetical protein
MRRGASKLELHLPPYFFLALANSMTELKRGVLGKCMTHLNTIQPPTSWFSLHSFFQTLQPPTRVALLHHSCYTPFPSDSPSFDNSNYTWRGVQIMKLLVMQFCPTSCHFVSPRPKCPPQHLNPCSSLNARDEVSLTYKNHRQNHSLAVNHSNFFKSNDSLYDNNATAHKINAYSRPKTKDV